MQRARAASDGLDRQARLPVHRRAVGPPGRGSWPQPRPVDRCIDLDRPVDPCPTGPTCSRGHRADGDGSIRGRKVVEPASWRPPPARVGWPLRATDSTSSPHESTPPSITAHALDGSWNGFGRPRRSQRPPRRRSWRRGPGWSTPRACRRVDEVYGTPSVRRGAIIDDGADTQARPSSGSRRSSASVREGTLGPHLPGRQ